MVLSRINDKINYIEEHSIDKEDKGFNASLYKIEVKELEPIIAMGDIKYKFIDDGVLYSPIYLIINNKVGSQIGIYEFDSENLMDLLDEDGDLDIEKLDDPLLYKFVSYEYLKQKIGEYVSDEDDEDEQEGVRGASPPEDEDEQEEAPPEDEEDRVRGASPPEDEEVERELTGDVEEGIEGDTFNLGEDNNEEGNLETRTTDDIEKKRFKNPRNWVQEMMKRNEYGLIDSLYEEIGTKKAGDCLFSVIQDALDSIGKKISVQKMRERLSKDMDEETFKHYKEFYDLFITQLNDDKEKLEKLKKIHDGLRIKGSQVKTTNRGEYKKVVEQAKGIEKTFSRIKKEKTTTEAYLKEFSFMKGIETLENMKKFIKTCDFWADTWAISILETIFNIKLIILSSENYKRKDYNNILLCGQINDEREIKEGVFKPKYYIVIDHTGGHYKLITWKEKKILTFDELPYSLRELIVRKCMEKNAGKFSQISKFQRFKKNLQKEEEDDKSLYTSKTILQFYSKSAEKPYPGKGSGEKLGDKERYLELSRIPNWRRILSNFSISPFTLDGHTWSGVEWYYQGSKFKKNNPEFYLLFSLDSGSEISKDAAMAKAAGGKTGVFSKTNKDGGKNKVVLREPSIKMDEDFFKIRHKEEMETAWKAKFTQDKEAKDVLLKTMDAKLQHFIRGKNPEVWSGLMRIRKELGRSELKV